MTTTCSTTSQIAGPQPVTSIKATLRPFMANLMRLKGQKLKSTSRRPSSSKVVVLKAIAPEMESKE